MQATTFFDSGYDWVVFGRDPGKPEAIIDTNQYLVNTGNGALLIDPGGIELFSAMLAMVLRHVRIEDITDLFASHQDPDIISSLGLWDKVLPEARLHAPRLWEGFLRHFGCDHIEYAGIPDDGGTIKVGGVELRLIPAHYLHASANFHLYDPNARIFYSGDVGAALEPAGAPMFVEDFKSHVPAMRFFHQRWMPSEEAKQVWLQRVRGLDIEFMCPQHGRIFQGDDVARFLDWFESLPVGIGLHGTRALGHYGA